MIIFGGIDANYFAWIRLIIKANFGDNPHNWWKSLPGWRIVIWIFWKKIIWRIQKNSRPSQTFKVNLMKKM